MLMPSLFCVMLTDICRKVNVFYRLRAPYGRDTSETFHCLTIYIYGFSGLLGGELIVYMYDIVYFRTFKTLTIAHPCDKLTL